MRLIDADELFKEVDGSKFKNNHKTSEGRMVHIGEHNHFMKMIADAPTVDAQPVVHAQWIELPKALNPNEKPCKCSHCEHVLSFMNNYPKSKYCDNCGARMDGESNDC